MKRYTIAEMRVANKKAGQHWFDQSAMAFFGTIIKSQPDRHNMFITSEQPPHGERTYSVRIFAPNGRVNTVGAFGIMTYTQALAWQQRVGEALDQASAREKHVLENLTHVSSPDEQGIMTFSTESYQFEIRTDDECDPKRRIIG